MGPLRVLRQEQFAQLIVKGRRVNEAYKEAGYVGGNEAACILHRKPHVQARIEELYGNKIKVEEKAVAKAVDKLALTKEYVLGRLMENVERAMQAVPVLDKKGQPTGEYRYEGSVANKALELLGREVGLFIQRTEVGAPGEFSAIDDPAKLRELILRRLVMNKPELVQNGVVSIEDQSGDDVS